MVPMVTCVWFEYDKLLGMRLKAERTLKAANRYTLTENTEIRSALGNLHDGFAWIHLVISRTFVFFCFFNWLLQYASIKSYGKMHSLLCMSIILA